MAQSSHESMITLCYIGLALLTLVPNFIILPINFNLVVTSFLIIYIGSYQSLDSRLKAKAGDKDAAEEMETMSAKDACMFPFIGSGVLFSLYLMFKLFDKEYVNMLLTFYFSVVGLLTLTSFFDPFVSKLSFFDGRNTGHEFKFTIPLYGKVEFSITFSEVVSCIFAACFSTMYFITKHWTMNNLFGISFCIQGIKSLSLGSYKIGSVLLVGLFFYDIFWVFGTDVMVSVAKSFDAPIKLLFPRSFATATAKAQFSLLGLGDIVIPGVFVALLLRFDAAQAGITKFQQTFSAPFFHTCLCGYVWGLFTTVVVMYAFEAAQPALLYLVPSCLVSSVITAIARGEFSELLAYDEEEENAQMAEKTKANKSK